MSDNDPLFALLQRYRMERKAFDEFRPAERMTERAWDRMARGTWFQTQTELIESELPATTAAGALLALDHVLESDELFFERSESADLQMLWLLIKAARDYIAGSAALETSMESEDCERVNLASPVAAEGV